MEKDKAVLEKIDRLAGKLGEAMGCISAADAQLIREYKGAYETERKLLKAAKLKLAEIAEEGFTVKVETEKPLKVTDFKPALACLFGLHQEFEFTPSFTRYVSYVSCLTNILFWEKMIYHMEPSPTDQEHLATTKQFLRVKLQELVTILFEEKKEGDLTYFQYLPKLKTKEARALIVEIYEFCLQSNLDIYRTLPRDHYSLLLFFRILFKETESAN